MTVSRFTVDSHIRDFEAYMLDDGNSHFRLLIRKTIQLCFGPLAILAVIAAMLLLGKALPSGPTAFEIVDRWVNKHDNLLTTRTADFLHEQLKRDEDGLLLLETPGRDHFQDKLSEQLVWTIPPPIGGRYGEVVVVHGVAVLPVSEATHRGDVSVRVSFEFTLIGSTVALTRLLDDFSSVQVVVVRTSDNGQKTKPHNSGAPSFQPRWSPAFRHSPARAGTDSTP